MMHSSRTTAGDGVSSVIALTKKRRVFRLDFVR
jgi:hypothetical protein